MNTTIEVTNCLQIEELVMLKLLQIHFILFSPYVLLVFRVGSKSLLHSCGCIVVIYSVTENN